MSTYLGVDRCEAGWLAVAFELTDFDHAAVFEEIGDVWARYEDDAERILVDVPIGLRSGEGERECDEQARAVLGPRSRVLFTPPVREATRKRRYPAAKRVHERRAGTELSRQAFAISDAIAAVDELLLNVPDARGVLAEARPAVCFRAFAEEPLAHSKYAAGGYAERMRALARYDADAPPVVQQVAEAAGGADVTVADVLDAVVVAYTARPGPGSLYTLPSDPPTDDEGLPMQMWYRRAEPFERD